MCKDRSEDAETSAQRRLRLDALRNQIRALESQLSQLKEEEKFQIHELQAMILKRAPINSISDDILREVFLHTLPTGREEALSVYSKPFREWESPLLLRRVCKYWKHTADNFSLLWTTLHLYIARKVTGTLGEETNCSMLKRWSTAWLRLTKDSHLQVHLIKRTGEKDLLSSILPPPAYGRLTKLSLGGTLTYEDIASLACGKDVVAFPLLEDLIIGDFGGELRPVKRRPIKVFEKCPRLRRAIVARIAHDDHIPTMPLPWQQLTHLVVLAVVPLKLYSNVMQDCLLLRFAFIVPQRLYLGHYDKYERISWNWPNLFSLTFDFWQAYTSPFFPIHLQHLQLGNLRSFRLMGPDSTVTEDDDALFHNTLRSMKALQHLSLCSFALGKRWYTETFQYLPQLKTLEIKLRKFWDRDHDPLKILADNLTILPHLVRLTIDIGPNWTHGFVTSALTAFIEARARSTVGKSSLEQVVICISMDRRRSIAKRALFMERLDELRGRSLGVDIHVRDEGEQRRTSKSVSYWVNRDEELVNSWPEARGAFFTRADNDYVSDSSDDSEGSSEDFY